MHNKGKTMAVIIIKKDCPPYEYKNKADAIKSIKAIGDDVKNYKFLYVYETMRLPYYPGYDKKHREASLRHYHKNKVLKCKAQGD